jgi:hypothetical protein
MEGAGINCVERIAFAKHNLPVTCYLIAADFTLDIAKALQYVNLNIIHIALLIARVTKYDVETRLYIVFTNKSDFCLKTLNVFKHMEEVA